MQIAEQTAKQNLGLESAPHLHAPLTTNAIMLLVLLALIPGFAVAVYFFGAGLILQFIVSALTALVCEALVALLRHRSVKRALTDRSALVTAALLALTIPPLLPWHLTVTATVFAILIVKHAFGGLGMNIFNPAMAGFIFLVISAPGVFYDTWLTPAPAAISVVTPDRAAGVIFMGDDPRVLYREVVALKEDAHTLTGATFLESVKTARKAGTQTTGNAAGSGRVTPFNLYIAPGSLTAEQLLLNLCDGLYLTEVSGLHAGANPIILRKGIEAVVEFYLEYGEG